MNEPKRRAARHSLTGTGLYIALFLGLTALAVAGYWMLLPSSADKTPTNVTEPPVTTPITAEPVTPDVPEVKPEEPAEPVRAGHRRGRRDLARRGFHVAAPALLRHKGRRDHRPAGISQVLTKEPIRWIGSFPVFVYRQPSTTASLSPRRAS